MNCETCNDLMMDLLYDELDADGARAAREHIAGCAPCKAAWERVSRGRALASTLSPVTAPLPSASLLAAVEAAASQSTPKAPELRAVAPLDADTPAPGGGGDPGVAPVIPLESAPRRVPTWLHRLGDLAMRRQVAMAAVALLSIGLASRFVPSHTPGSIEADSVSPAPQVIPAQELPAEQPPVAAQSPLPAVPRARFANRAPESHRAMRPAPRPAAPSQAQAETLADESAPIAQNAIAMHSNTPIAVTGGAPAASPSASRSTAGAPAAPPSDSRYGSAANADSLRLNAPTAVAAAERDLGRALPTLPAATTRGGAPNAAEEGRAQSANEALIASYRAALDANPPEAERVRIATALAAQLSRSGRIAEAEVVRARYLRVARDPAAQVDVAERPATSTPHVPTSIPHPSRQRPARRSMPSSTNIQAY
ncbi:MAG: hypothetical protein R3A48_13715 [Polyangiales bacterium]